MKYLLYYLAAISVVSVIVCIYDKIAAKHKWQRTSENALLFLSVLGGALAMYITMRIIRHKTKHTKFMLGLPIIILVQIAAILLVFVKFYKN
ncbi:MAG: DUF1294 domain-containing protein [Clostridia bacterium]|nr:DUF1294 domain-containing protein [Clostridia bacterium]